MPLVSSMFSTERTIAHRLAVCENCPHSAHKSVFHLCTQCGCIIPLKVRLRGSECPLQLWTAEIDDGEVHHVNDKVWVELDSTPNSDDHK